MLIEQVNCQCSLSCCEDKDGTVATIKNGDKFYLTYHFSPNNTNQEQINLNDFNLNVTYWILGHEDTTISYQKQSVTDDRCIVDSANNIIKFVFNNYTLESGKLIAKYVFTFSNPLPGGNPIVKEIECFTGVILK